MNNLKKNVLNSSMLLVLFIFVLLYNAKYLAYNYTYIEQMDMFLYNSEYAVNRISQLGGLMSYLSAFVTQFFVSPNMSIVIVTVLFFVVALEVYAFWKRVSPKHFYPILILLPSVTLLWVQADFNYHWSGTISVIFVLLILNIYIRIENFKRRIAFMFLFSWICYYLIGPSIFIAIISSIIYEVSDSSKKRRWWSLLFIPWSVLLPYILYKMDFICSLEQAYTFDIYYHSQLKAEKVHYYVALAIILNIIFCMLLRYRKPVKSFSLYVSSVVLQLCICAYVMHAGVKKYNPAQNYYVKQLDYYSRTKQWDKILTFKELRSGQNLMHACFQNLALSETNQLGDALLKYHQAGARGLVIPWNQSVMSSMLLSDVFYRMGNIALSQTMAFEGMVGTESSMNPRMLIRLIQTNLILGHYNVAKKYISILEDTFFYGEMVQHYRKLAENPDEINSDPELGELRKCISKSEGLVNSGLFADGLRKVITSYTGYSPSLEYYGALCLLSKNMNAFKEIAEIYLRDNIKMPYYFQEAYIMLHEGESEEQWQKYGISNNVIQRFKSYCNDVISLRKKRNNIAYVLKDRYNDTFWFYYMFGK